MIYNMAQLLKSGVGYSFEADIDENNVTLDEDLTVIGPVVGHVRMRRTNQGLLVDGWVDLNLELTCDRCLKTFEQAMHVPFEELFYPTVDVVTGGPVAPIEEEDAFPIDDHHMVDLTEAIRQRILIALPMRRICKEDCKGLCPQCGTDLNQGSCDCQPEVDERMSVLAKLLQNSSEAQA